MKQRVSDERLVQIVDGWPDVEWGHLAADLRDCRALLAAVAPVVKAAVRRWERHNAWLGCHCDECAVVFALTDDVRKEFTG